MRHNNEAINPVDEKAFILGTLKTVPNSSNFSSVPAATSAGFLEVAVIELLTPGFSATGFDTPTGALA